MNVGVFQQPVYAINMHRFDLPARVRSEADRKVTYTKPGGSVTNMVCIQHADVSRHKVT